MTRLAVVLVFTALLFGCVAQSGVPPEPETTEAAAGFELLESGIKELARNAKNAKEEYFDRVISDCSITYADSQMRLYYARTPQESLFYLLKSAAEEQRATVLDVPCAEAHYYAAYAAIDLGDISSAESNLKEALQWSPVNPRFLMEFGHIKHIQRDWAAALELFSEAEENVPAFSPDEVITTELARAKRGVGYSLIELGELDQAEAKFLECLELDPSDHRAKHELEYISHIKSQADQRSEVD